MSNTTTRKQIEGMLQRLCKNTGTEFTYEHAYGNHYQLSQVVNEAGGVRTIGPYCIGKRAFYDALFSMNAIIEHMRYEKKEIEA